MKWTVDHLGNEDHLNNAFIQYSSNFSDETQVVRSAGKNLKFFTYSENKKNNFHFYFKEVYWESKKDQLKNQEIILDEAIPEYNQVKLQIETMSGTSEKSDIFQARCKDENNCPSNIINKILFCEA